MKLMTIKSMTANKSAKLRTVAAFAVTLIIFLSFPYYSDADTAGPNSTSKGSNNSSIGSRSWSNTDKIYTSDNNYSTVSLDKDKISNYLVASDFRFSIPTEAVINGIKVDVERKEGNKHSSGYIRDYSIKILKNNTITGTDHAVTTTNWSTSDQTVSYGSSTDLWGQTWTSSDINLSSFGVAIAVKCTSDDEDAKIDNLKITVYYTIVLPCAANTPTVNITPSSQTITTNGGSASYSVTITNNDSGSGCSNVTYTLSSSDSNTANFNTSTLSPGSVTLASGATSSAITLTVNAKAGQTSGTDTTTVTASATGHTDVNNSVITTLNVPTCAANTPSVNITPASQTITTDGGSSVYSVTVKNNDTGNGCSNVTYTLVSSDSNTTNFSASTLGSNSATLAAGATSSAITLTVSGKTGQTTGVNQTSVTASAAGHVNGISNNVTTTINVYVPPALPYSVISCNDCHKTIPVDATGRRGTPPTAVIGSHSVHASGLGLACTACHISNANNLGHRNGKINMQYPINGQGTGSYSKGASFSQNNDLTGAGLGTCSSTYCHGSVSTTPKWGTNTGKIGTCDLCHGMAGTNPSRDTEGHTAVTDPQVGAHNAHLNSAHNISQKIACNECHAVPANLDSAGHYDTARPAEVPLNGTIAKAGGALPLYSAGKCSNTWCHGAKLSEGDKPPVWNVPLFTGDKNNDCAQCHGFPPLQIADHTGLDVNKTGECAGCHDHVNANNDGFIDSAKHIDGKVGVSCIGCHSTIKGKRAPVVGQFSANSHHIQGVTLTNEHCYQCHWEANSDGTINSTYHGGSAKSGSAVNLVIYGNGTRPSAYTLGTTAVEYIAGLTETTIISSEVNVVDTWRKLTTSGSGASRTATFTAGAGASGNRMAIVGIAWEDSHSSGCNPSSITGNYGGQTITTINKANASSNKEGQWMGYIGETGISARSNNTITLTFSGCTPDRTPTISAATYEGVDQASAPASVIASGTSGSSFSWSGLPVVKDGYAMYNLNADGISSFTPPSTYTERYDTATTNFRMTGGDKAITADGTESRTVTGNTSSSRWALVAVSLKPIINSTSGISRTELQKINQHCLGCHSTQNNSVQPFGDGKTPKQYSWDGTSVNDRYSQTGATAWGKYSGANITPKNTQTKAYSAHGNASANQRGWNTSETWPNTSGTIQVLCFDCHNSHGSTVSGTTTSYTSANTNGGLLKDTTAGLGGYTMTYKPATGGSAAEHNRYNPGAALCFDCHLTANEDTTKPWGYQGTFGASQAIMGYMDTQYFGPGTFGYQQRYAYKALLTMKGGHFGASLSPATPVMGTIDGLCTPCHDPHGVSASLGANQAYGAPLLKGTWMTSPYKEDAAPLATNERRGGGEDGDYVFSDASTPSYNIDQNTFDTATTNSNGGFTWNFNSTKRIAETVDKFGGLCIKCHPKTSINATTSGAWKSTNRVHNTVKGWGGSGANINNSVHSYTCSKCHAPHNSALNRLMVTNCLDFSHRGRVVAGGPVPPQHSYRGDEGHGAGRFPGGGGGTGDEEATNNGPFFFGTASSPYTRACHDNANSDGYPANQRWNAKTLW